MLTLEREQPKSIGFRLDREYRALLESAAAGYGVSPGQYAKRLVIDALNDSERVLIRDDLQRLLKELGSLKRTVANSVLALLVSAGKLTKSEANDWAKKFLAPEMGDATPGRKAKSA